ncbi:MarR family winged helix-turn-helix transcriptional regulator [Herbiconiux sp. CPCC 203407]|uniref:MarR family winged helix-turn-helix transcriptional regulator n=1 Tax=Herbiconiux oxytropis TaxID=2970915 RepID=A0AA42BW45_9MICO|nr:MarR family winged helix-turn-helix transcriptional regulator [Herbiconiux oxytropis]MCS5723906.1 MarR family winged helix-turn-helix transcriptional regulator [Herbiconiux oxytropis]MCS5725438.1 MarR family winged helix-turn-helix transcriptional regulator [Herbiconiux oxytropis]
MSGDPNPGERNELAERQTWFALLSVAQGLTPRMDEFLKRTFGITYIELSILIMLAESDDGSQELSALARRTHTSLSRMSHTVRRLQKAELLTLARSPHDGRATIAVLAEAGSELVAVAGPANRDAVQDLVFRVLDREQQDQLREIMLTLLRSWRPDDPHPWLP